MKQAEETNKTGKSKLLAVGDDNNYYLVASKCPECGEIFFPEKPVCPACLNYKELRRILIGRFGEINTFTVAHVAPSGFQAPYIMGFVDLVEGPRIFSIIDGGTNEAACLAKGDRVELVVEEETDESTGNQILKWKYTPIGKKRG